MCVFVGFVSVGTVLACRFWGRWGRCGLGGFEGLWGLCELWWFWGRLRRCELWRR